MNGQLTVGQAALAAGLTPKAVRLYEARGLLAPAPRTAAGYRLYSGDDVEVLTFIRRARALGLGLPAIADILAARRSGPPCATARGKLDARIAEVDLAIAELQALRATLASAREGADRAESGRDARVCPIIEQR